MAENTPPNRAVGLPIRATDPDGDTLTYSIRGRTAEDDVSLFSFNDKTGQLTTKENLNHDIDKTSYLYRVTVSDGRGGADGIDLTVEVTDVNEAPGVFEQIGDQIITVGGSSLEIDLSGKFSDPEGDTLRYAVSSSDEAVATVSESDGRLTIAPVAVGSATITVSATDPGGLSASQTFDVTVIGVTISEVVPGVTSVFVKVKWSSLPSGLNRKSLTLNWDQTSGLPCRLPGVSCPGEATLLPRELTHVVEDSFAENSDYVFSVTAEVTLNGEEYTIKTELPGIVRTLDPTASPRIASLNGEPENKPLKDQRKWGVLDSAYVVLGVSQGDPYRFAVEAPVATGMQAADVLCDWSSGGATTSAWRRKNDWFPLVHCSVGDGSTPLTIKIGVVDGSTTHDLGTYATTDAIPQSWHTHENTVHYYVRGSGADPHATHATGVEDGDVEGMFPSDRPSHLAFDKTPSDDLLLLANYADAAGKWNDVKAGVTIERVHSNSGVDVIVMGYWEPGKKDDICNGSVACFKHSYPHISTEKRLLIEDPPLWREDYEDNPPITSREWTTSLQEFINDRERFVYLPAILLHEFGHTFGLGHGVSAGIMAGHFDLDALSSDDKEGAKAIYQDPHLKEGH